MKQYLLVRWKKRWPVVAVSALLAPVWVARAAATHDGKAWNVIVLLICFDLVGILFPFRWGGET